jgi:putative membrane protein
MTIVTNLPAFLLYFGTAIALFAAFLVAYTRVLPLHEWRLIREGNTAVALVLAGAMLGFAMPLAMAIARSESIADMAVWAAISLIVQLLCFGALRLAWPNASTALAAGDMAEAVILAALSVVLGLLNAACLT